MAMHMKKDDKTRVKDLMLGSEHWVLCPEVHLGKVKFLDWKVFHVINGDEVRKLDELAVDDCNNKL